MAWSLWELVFAFCMSCCVRVCACVCVCVCARARVCVGTVMGCFPFSSRLITICLRATPLNITIIQTYAPLTEYNDDVVEDFCNQIQADIDETHKKDYIAGQGDWNTKIDVQTNWQGTFGTSCNSGTNERGLWLLEFAATNNLVIANTFGNHKPSRLWTWHHADGHTHTPIDYILVEKRFHSRLKTAITHSLP